MKIDHTNTTHMQEILILPRYTEFLINGIFRILLNVNIFDLSTIMDWNPLWTVYIYIYIYFGRLLEVFSYNRWFFDDFATNRFIVLPATFTVTDYLWAYRRTSLTSISRQIYHRYIIIVTYRSSTFNVLFLLLSFFRFSAVTR